MNLLNQLAYDAVNTFLVDFGEPITYTPEGGSPITITAIINRNPASAILGFSGTGNYKHEIMVANDPTEGVVTINKGKDIVAFSNVVGGAVQSFQVMQILQNDQGMWHLAVG